MERHDVSQTHSRGPLASPMICGPSLNTYPPQGGRNQRALSSSPPRRSYRVDTTGASPRETGSYSPAVILTPPGGRISTPCLRARHVRCVQGPLLDTEQQAPGHLAPRCFTSFSMTCIERLCGTLYLLSTVHWPRSLAARDIRSASDPGLQNGAMWVQSIAGDRLRPR